MLEDFEGSRTEFMKMLAEHDGPPAYVLRAQRVEEVWLQLVQRCEQEKLELLDMPKTRLAQLGALIGHQWSSASCLVREPDFGEYLSELFERWQPKLRLPIEETTSQRKHKSAIVALSTSFERFNRRMRKFVSRQVLDNVNFERSEYNDYYLVEKAAAMGSDKLAAMGFEPLAMCTHDDLLEAVPLLNEPTVI